MREKGKHLNRTCNNNNKEVVLKDEGRGNHGTEEKQFFSNAEFGKFNTY
jgi:hypothetical protein